MVWLCQTKIWKRKSKTVLYGYRHFIVYVKTDDIYKDIAEDVEIKFNTSNCELERQFIKGTKIVIGLTKDELDGKIMKKYIELGAKT